MASKYRDQTKYTRELLEPIVSSAFSYREVARALGFAGYGRPNSYIKHRIQAMGISTTHFSLAKAFRKRNPVSPHALTAEQVLVKDRKGDGSREEACKVRWAMAASGISEKCVACGLGPTWNGKSLRLQIDHINGDGADNRLENVRFLCPNCHTQTPNYGNKNRDMPKKVRVWSPKEKYRSTPRKTKITWPLPLELRAMAAQMPTTEIAKTLGVSDRAVAKHCQQIGVGLRGRGGWTADFMRKQSHVNAASGSIDERPLFNGTK